MRKGYIQLIAGLLILPSIFLQTDIVFIFLQALYAIILAISQKKKFKLLPNLILLISLSTIHLLQPNGLLLTKVGPFNITLGALILGARKAFILISLLYLSHYMVSGKVRLPGKIGSIISLQLLYVGKITSTWASLENKRPFIEAIDKLLFSLEEKEVIEEDKKESSDTPLIGPILINLVHICVFWIFYLLPKFGYTISLL